AGRHTRSRHSRLGPICRATSQPSVGRCAGCRRRSPRRIRRTLRHRSAFRRSTARSGSDRPRRLPPSLERMAQYIYTMRNVRKAVGDKVILDNVTLAFLPGAKIGVVGPNGAGKSTVLKIMAGLDTASNGDAFLSPGYSVGILLQEPPLDDTKDVLGNVMEAVRPVKELLERYEEVSDKMAVEYTDELGIEQGELLEKIEHAGGWDLDSRVEIDRGRCYPYEGNYTTYLDTKSQRLKVEGAKDAKRKREIERELEWVRSNPKARQAKSKARLSRFEELVAEADRNRPVDGDVIQIPPGPRLGTQVLEADALKKGFGDRILIDGLTFDLPQGGIVGIMGPNGV